MAIERKWLRRGLLWAAIDSGLSISCQYFAQYFTCRTQCSVFYMLWFIPIQVPLAAFPLWLYIAAIGAAAESINSDVDAAIHEISQGAARGVVFEAYDAIRARADALIRPFRRWYVLEAFAAYLIFANVYGALGTVAYTQDIRVGPNVYVNPWQDCEWNPDPKWKPWWFATDRHGPEALTRGYFSVVRLVQFGVLMGLLKRVNVLSTTLKLAYTNAVVGRAASASEVWLFAEYMAERPLRWTLFSVRAPHTLAKKILIGMVVSTIASNLSRFIRESEVAPK
jgi:hypothetical protein